MRLVIGKPGRGQDTKSLCLGLRQKLARRGARCDLRVLPGTRGAVPAGIPGRPGETRQPVPAFATLPMLKDWLEQRCKALWSEITHGKLPGTLAEVWVQERPLLMPMPGPFEGFVEHTKRVSPTCLVHFERNRYSVPASYLRNAR